RRYRLRSFFLLVIARSEATWRSRLDCFASLAMTVWCSENSAAHLIELDALEQRLEIALAEALVALALDDLEEDRTDHVLGENLQQQALPLGGGAVHQYAALLQFADALLMAFDALGQQLVIGFGRVLELDAAGA